MYWDVHSWGDWQLSWMFSALTAVRRSTWKGFDNTFQRQQLLLLMSFPFGILLTCSKMSVRGITYDWPRTVTWHLELVGMETREKKPAGLASARAWWVSVLLLPASLWRFVWTFKMQVSAEVSAESEGNSATLASDWLTFHPSHSYVTGNHGNNDETSWKESSDALQTNKDEFFLFGFVFKCNYFKVNRLSFAAVTILISHHLNPQLLPEMDEDEDQGEEEVGQAAARCSAGAPVWIKIQT